MKLTLRLLEAFLVVNTAKSRGRQEREIAGMLKNIRGHFPAKNGQRYLEEHTAIATRCWTQCVKLKLNADECMDLIKNELGPDLSLHEIPDLKIKIHKPRNEYWFEQTYFQVGIPTDVHGNVACDKSVIRYPYKWQILSSDQVLSVDVPDYDCIGKGAIECCADYKLFLTNQGIPLQDHKNNCLSCWVHQEPLEPVLNGVGDVMYRDHQYDSASKQCQAATLSDTEVVAIDSETAMALKDDKMAIETILAQNSVSCAQLKNLQERLLIHARGVGTAMTIASTLLCKYCMDVPGSAGVGGGYDPIPTELADRLVNLSARIAKATIKSNVNKIIIYADKDGHVIEPPKVGGNPANIDWNLDDPDCEENTNSLPPGTAFDNRGGDGLYLPTCAANEVASTPIYGAKFSPTDVAFSCSSPTGTLMADTSGYTIELVDFDNTFVKAGSKRSRFIYYVCSKLDDLISKIVLPWKGHCAVTKYKYLDIEFDGCGYAAGKDTTSCVAGFIFNESWKSTASFSDPASRRVCAEFLLEVDGWVSMGESMASVITESNQYALISVPVPDCTAC